MSRRPVKTIPEKYQQYFDDNFGDGSNDKAHLLCCRNAQSIPDDDEKIGPHLAELAKAAYGGLTNAEEHIFVHWPPSQLRVLVSGLQAIFGIEKDECPSGPVRKAKFRGRSGHDDLAIEVRASEDLVKITFYGP